MLYPMPLYSLCTENQEFVFAQNFPVSTWRETDFLSTRLCKTNGWEKL